MKTSHTAVFNLYLSRLPVCVCLSADLDFNPENDRQAEDRCHRIGQLKDVTVYKLITEDSVDENIFDMGERKKR